MFFFQQTKNTNISTIKDAFGPQLKDHLPGTPLPALLNDSTEELYEPPQPLVLFEKAEVNKNQHKFRKNNNNYMYTGLCRALQRKLDSSPCKSETDVL